MSRMNPENILSTGKEVIRLEGEALLTFADQLNQPFIDAVEAMYASKGRVIVSGMGKSGHIGRKIAATLASTGTPAQFVHPAEASHGDLGMITENDVVLMLSNSGETAELASIIDHAHRFSIPLIGVASVANSTLLQSANFPILLPQAKEACPMGLTPTTSTTATLALGDALAVSLMELRQFQPEDFRNLHPGGKLGANLLRVEDLMHKGDAIPLVGEECQMTEAIITMSAKGFGVVGVLDDKERLCGIITDGDLRRNMNSLHRMKAGEVMSRDPKTVIAGSLASKALAIMSENKITSLFIMETELSTIPVGLLHLHDCLRAGIDAE